MQTPYTDPNRTFDERAREIASAINTYASTVRPYSRLAYISLSQICATK